MKFTHLFKQIDINEELKRFDEMPHALLLDVRTPQEYSEGHIPCSVNIPGYELHRMEEMGLGRDTPVYVYCHSGVRSRAAVQLLRAMGYRNARNIGGIENYLGRIEQKTDNVTFRSMQELDSGAWRAVLNGL